MAQPTAGGFLSAAAKQVAVASEQRVSRAELLEVASAFGLVLASLARHLDGNSLAGRWLQAAASARSHLDRPARLLRPTGLVPLARLPGARRGPAAESLALAARSLTAARDLLHTHFAPNSDGGAAYLSGWAAVVESPAVARAMASEVAGFAGRLEVIAARWSGASAGWPEFAREARAFAAAHQDLRAVGHVMRESLLCEPATPEDRVLLYAIPVNARIPAVPPQAVGSVESICRATILAAERARQAIWEPRHPWSAENSDASLRRTAAAAVVIGHNCESALDLLSERAGQMGRTELADSLTRASEAAFTARSRWMDVAQRWNGQVVTATASSPNPTGPCAAAGDLAVWSGRLVFSDPGWTPERGRRGGPRTSEELANDEDAIGRAVAAIHHTADALHHLADAEFAQARMVAQAGSLYVPSRSLPPDRRSARLYSPAPSSRIHELLRAYSEAEADSGQLAGTMDRAAGAARAPSQVLLLTRAAVGRAAETAATTAEDAARSGRRSAGPVTRLLRDRGVTTPDLLALAGELDDVARGPGLAERRAILQQGYRKSRPEIEPEAGG